MTKEEAQKILHRVVEEKNEYVSIHHDESVLDGHFTADELEAVAVLMRTSETGQPK